MKFTIGQILNVYDGRLLTSIDNFYKLLNFLTGENLFTHQLPRARKECLADLERQLPWLASPDMKMWQEDLTRDLKNQPQSKVKSIISEWLTKVGKQFGQEHELQPLAIQNHRNPLEELVDMVGSEKVIVTEI